VSQDLRTREKSPSRPKSSRRLDRAVNARTDPDDARFERAPGEPLGRDILKNRFVSAVMRSRWYPGALQIPVAAVFGLVAYELLAGPPPPTTMPAQR